MDKKSGTMKNVNGLPQGGTSGGNSFDLDVSDLVNPLVDALNRIALAVAQIKPVITVPPLPVMVRPAEVVIQPVQISLPELSPSINVYPPDVTLPPMVPNIEVHRDGAALPICPKIDVLIPWKPMLIVGAIPTLLLLADLFVRFHG